MIYTREGDLLRSNMDVIAHGCNCFNTMGSGIARQIREQFPKAYIADLTTAPGDYGKMGTFTSAEQNGKIVYNLYTQYRYGRDPNVVYLEYDHLQNALDAMKKDLQSRGIYDTVSLGLPMIGCGLANGDWSMVSDVIEHVFDDKDVYIYVYGGE